MAVWVESQHPRAANGQFITKVSVSKSGSGTAVSVTKSTKGSVTQQAYKNTGDVQSSKKIVSAGKTNASPVPLKATRKRRSQKSRSTAVTQRFAS